MSLFRNNTFVVVNTVGFLVGMGMFGTITFLPLFLQVVKGVSPTGSGLFLVPMMGGLIFASTMAGRIMSKTGRYRLMPAISTGVLALAMVVLTTVGTDSPLWLIGGTMVLVGLGLVVVAIKLFGSSVSEKFARANEVQPCLSMFFNKLPYEPERLEDVGMPDAEPDEEPRMSRSELLDRFDGRLPEDVLARLRGEFDTSG